MSITFLFASYQFVLFSHSLRRTYRDRAYYSFSIFAYEFSTSASDKSQTTRIFVSNRPRMGKIVSSHSILPTHFQINPHVSKRWPLCKDLIHIGVYLGCVFIVYDIVVLMNHNFVYKWYEGKVCIMFPIDASMLLIFS